MKISSINDLSKVAHKLPTNVLKDINQRITDWISSGGEYTDNYIKQQCKYAENILNSLGVNE